METAFAFCIVKYETRLRHGNPQNYKEIEKKVMAEFLESSKNHPIRQAATRRQS